mmetsp:Transcript_9134/g.26923  ORF Transcript_9134/g.26923 Transcript_9134/m.26923 type:complete len:239 (+) Transcript_9134:323-1039(+)
MQIVRWIGHVRCWGHGCSWAYSAVAPPDVRRRSPVALVRVGAGTRRDARPLPYACRRARRVTRRSARVVRPPLRPTAPRAAGPGRGVCPRRGRGWPGSGMLATSTNAPRRAAGRRCTSSRFGCEPLGATRSCGRYWSRRSSSRARRARRGAGRGEQSPASSAQTPRDLHTWRGAALARPREAPRARGPHAGTPQPRFAAHPRHRQRGACHARRGWRTARSLQGLGAWPGAIAHRSPRR